MNEEKRTKARTDAMARFSDPGPGHINCAQAVVGYALDVMGDDPDLIKVASYFGGGVASMGEVCGAISGAAMALGFGEYRASGGDPQRAQRAKEALQAMVRAFAEEFGACRCRDLTGFDVSTPEGFAAFKASEARDRCPGYVEWAIGEITPLIDPDDS